MLQLEFDTMDFTHLYDLYKWKVLCWKKNVGVIFEPCSCGLL